MTFSADSSSTSSLLDSVTDATVSASTPARAVRGITVDAEGAARHYAMEKMALAAGLVPAQPLYTPGTMVIDMGVSNARASRVEHEEKPATKDAARALIVKVRSEHRRDVQIAARDLVMCPDGLLGVRGKKGHLALGERTVRSLSSRLGIPGGGGYLPHCPPALRATNVNHWISEIGANEDSAAAMARATGAEVPEADQLVMRIRDYKPAQHEVYAVVSPGYAAFDTDKIAMAIGMAAPEGSRGTVKYDGFRMEAEVLWHSDVQPEKYVAGEFFKAGVIIRSDDTGGGGIKVSAAVWQNLCLNLIVIDQAEKQFSSIRHVGSVEALAEKFRKAFKAAIDSLSGFRKAWGYASAENVVATIQEREPEARGLSVDEVFPGIFTAMVMQETIETKGRTKDIVDDLMRMWREDDSAAAGPTRAAVANAVTRYAHKVNQDPWAEQGMQRAAGEILYSSKPLAWTAAR